MIASPIATLKRTGTHIDYRQVLAVDANGITGIHSGSKALGTWTEACPIEELAALWELYKPQLDAYVTRAINPSDAPSYGVPGDE